MVFISERIVNIAELESNIRMARFSFDVLIGELEKAMPSKEVIDGAIHTISESLKKAEKFEFCIEKRKCHFKEDSENPTIEENHTEVGNGD